jgi:hypothetical protein
MAGNHGRQPWQATMAGKSALTCPQNEQRNAGFRDQSYVRLLSDEFCRITRSSILYKQSAGAMIQERHQHF